MDNESDRIRALESYQLLDTRPEVLLDQIVQLASKIFSVPIVLVSLIDSRRQWFKAKVGLGLGELPREEAFCDHTIRAESPLIIADALADSRFANNSLVLGPPGIRFYCGVPLRTPQGHGLGALCIIDRAPRTIDPATVESLVRLARLVMTEFEVRRRLGLVEETLRVANENQRAKELLASMVVHDLRSPLTAIGLLASVLADAGTGSGQIVSELMSSIEQMQHMLTDILDISLGEAGKLRPRTCPIIVQRLLEASIAGLRPLAETRTQRLVVTAPPSALHLTADPELLNRVLSNLIGNAIQYGPAGQTIAINVQQLDTGGVRFEVVDRCPPIPAEATQSIFRPFERVDPHWRPEGRGLGLTFCRLAVEAHGGTIGVVPELSGNRFFFELPPAK